MAQLALCLAAGAALSVAMGQDANWDLLNYHLYNGFAALHGRFDRDLLPTGLQSYLNPLLDAVYAGLALGPLLHAPRALAAVTGLWYGALIFLASRLARLLTPSGWVAAGATALGVTGAATVSQVGTATEEVQVATVMLLGLVTMAEPGGSARRRIVVGGLLFGVAAGLKLTAAAYAPGALLMAFVLSGGVRRAAAAGLLFSCGWIGGFALADGWWAALVAARFGSPAFPMFNGLFRSPLYPLASLLDGRFFPHGVLQWLDYPLAWAVHPASVVSELPLRDPRLAVALLLGLASLLRPPREPATRALLVFAGAGYAAWLATSSILRYAVVLEVAAGLLAPVLALALTRPFIAPRLVPAPALAIAAIIMAATRYPATLRIPYGAETLRADAAELQPDTLLVLTFRAPVSYLATLLPQQDSLTLVNLGDTVLEARGWGLHDSLVQMVRDHAGPIRVLTAGAPDNGYPELAEIGLSRTVAECRTVTSNFAAAGTAATAQLCTGTKASPRALTSPFWAQAARRYRTVVQIGDTTENLVGAAYLAAAGPAARGTHLIDWTDLLWSGVGANHAGLPPRFDPASLYVLPPAAVPSARGRLDAGRDLLAQVDGLIVMAPGWRVCAGCTAETAPAPD